MRRLQFSLKMMLWLMAVGGAFCAGARFERYLAERRADATETRIFAALDEKTDLDFTDQPLQNVVDYLQERHRIVIRLDTEAINEAGVRSDTLVTRTFKGISLRSALKLLLGELELTYVVQNGVLITSRTEAENMLGARILRQKPFVPGGRPAGQNPSSREWPATVLRRKRVA